jgi:hypothetical protein
MIRLWCFLRAPVAALGWEKPARCLPTGGFSFALIGQAAMLRFSATVTTQRVGELDVSSLIEQTNPVTGKPFMVKVVFSFRYWA